VFEALPFLSRISSDTTISNYRKHSLGCVTSDGNALPGQFTLKVPAVAAPADLLIAASEHLYDDVVDDDASNSHRRLIT